MVTLACYREKTRATEKPRSPNVAITSTVHLLCRAHRSPHKMTATCSIVKKRLRRPPHLVQARLIPPRRIPRAPGLHRRAHSDRRPPLEFQLTSNPAAHAPILDPAIRRKMIRSPVVPKRRRRLPGTFALAGVAPLPRNARQPSRPRHRAFQRLDVMPMLGRLKYRADAARLRMLLRSNIGYFGPYESILRDGSPRGTGARAPPAASPSDSRRTATSKAIRRSPRPPTRKSSRAR
jgi:hypothetical protein